MYVCSVFPQAVKLFVTLYQKKKKKWLYSYGFSPHPFTGLRFVSSMHSLQLLFFCTILGCKINKVNFDS